MCQTDIRLKSEVNDSVVCNKATCRILYDSYTILYISGLICRVYVTFRAKSVVMKPEFEKVSGVPQRSFLVRTVRRNSRPELKSAWHYHPEIEICYTRESRGKRFVGNQIGGYKKLDLVVFGPNLPHGFTTDMYSEQVVIQMNKDFLGERFFELPELNRVKTLFEDSSRGLLFYGKAQQEAGKLIDRIEEKEGLGQLIELLSLLKVLAASDERELICSQEYATDFNSASLERIKIVYQHILQNFTKEIKVKEVADLLNLTEATFFKFIKRHTKKTFTEILNEFRISQACNLLISTDKPISVVCFESGFNNISYFNRKFGQLMGQTPSSFKQTYSSKTDS